MRDWNTRILIFSSSGSQNSYLGNESLIVRKGKMHMEFDLRFSSVGEGLEYVATHLAAEDLCVFKRGETLPLNTAEDVRNAITYGFYSMQEEKYWLSHEIFEDLWRHFQGDVSTFFHGVILICVSMVHYQMENMANSMRIFRTAKGILCNFIREAGNWNFEYPLPGNMLQSLKEEAFRLVNV